jgi:hypothetical protein
LFFGLFFFLLSNGFFLVWFSFFQFILVYFLTKPFWFGLVFFLFQTYETETEPNRFFLKYSNRFNWFFSWFDFDYFFYFPGLISLSFFILSSIIYKGINSSVYGSHKPPFDIPCNIFSKINLMHVCSVIPTMYLVLRVLK